MRSGAGLGLLILAAVFAVTLALWPAAATGGAGPHAAAKARARFEIGARAAADTAAWNPYLGIGEPIRPGASTGGAGPLWLLAQQSDEPWAFSWTLALRLAVAAAGAFALAWHLGHGARGSVAAGVAFGLAPWVARGLAAPELNAAAALPWVLFCAARLAQQPGLGWLLGATVAVVAALADSGAWALPLLAAAAATLAVLHVPARGPWPLLAVAPAALLAAPSWLPWLEDQSIRWPPEAARAAAFHWTLVLPSPLAPAGSVCLGAVPLLLAIVAAVRRGWWVWWWALAATLAGALWAGFAVGAALLVALAAGATVRRLPLPLAVVGLVLIAGEAALALAGGVDRDPAPFDAEQVARSPVPPALRSFDPPPGSRPRWVAHAQVLDPAQSALLGWADARPAAPWVSAGYAALVADLLDDFAPLRGVAEPAALRALERGRSGRALDLLGVRYLLVPAAMAVGVKSARPVEGDDRLAIVWRETALRRAFFPRRVERVDSSDEALARMAALDFAPAEVAYLETDALTLTEGPPSGSAHVEAQPSAAELVLRAQTSAPAWLLVSIAATPELRAEVRRWSGGQRTVAPVPILVADGALAALQLPRGRSEVRLWYERRRHAGAAVLRWVGAGLLLAAAAWVVRKREALD
ncbi:MAG: hypothetical protein AAF628_01345 [Planctomycetota bacterium]